MREEESIIKRWKSREKKKWFSLTLADVRYCWRLKKKKSRV